MAEVSNNAKVKISKIVNTAKAGKNNGVKPTTQLNIGEKLQTYLNSSSTGSKKANVVSQEQYTYQDIQGTLVKLDDGSVIFAAKKQVNGKDVVYNLKFKNENDLKKQRPSSEILNPGKANQVKTNYEYHRNGQVKNKDIYNAKNNLIRQEEYNKEGKIQNRKLYDKDGNLQSNIKFEHNNKDHTSVAKVYDKDNKLVSTAHNQYKEDGKTLVSQEVVHYPDGNLQSKSECYDNGKVHTKTEYYENGAVKAETECWDNGAIKEQKQYDENGKVTKKITAEIDGNFENSAQISEGDCYLLATINSIRNVDGGQEMLKDLVKITTNENGEKVYTVTLPGAQAAAEGLRTDDRVDPDKMYITGTYTFTESEMQEILKQAGQKYSQGDGDVILLEAAFEKYRQEVAQTLDANPDLKTEMGVAGTQTGSNRNNILAGGYSEDPTFILTGKQSSVYSIHKDNPPYGLSYEDLQQGNITVVPTNQHSGEMSKGAVSEVDGDYTKDKKELNEMLDSIMHDGEDGHIDNVAVASFVVVRADGKPGGHALTIKSVTKDTVTLINPWNPDKEVTMSREDFIKSASHVTVSDTTKPSVTPEDVQNQQSQQTQQNNSEQNVYPAKRGDNLWKIVKQHLGQRATATQIANYINKVMAANPNLKWDKGHTFVLIRPGDNIVLP